MNNFYLLTYLTTFLYFTKVLIINLLNIFFYTVLLIIKIRILFGLLNIGMLILTECLIQLIFIRIVKLLIYL